MKSSVQEYGEIVARVSVVVQVWWLCQSCIFQ